MDIGVWLSFVVASAVLLAIPGPTTLTVISYSMSHGRLVAIPLAVAVGIGDTAALAASVLGLGTLLATSAFWFSALKWTGGLYLIYLGIKMLREGIVLDRKVEPHASTPRRHLFANAFVVTALNPKSVVFFVAFFPQFIDSSRDAAFQLGLLATTFVVLSMVSTTLYALFAGSLHGIMDSRRARRCFSFSGASLLSAAGIWALLSRRPA